MASDTVIPPTAPVGHPSRRERDRPARWLVLAPLAAALAVFLPILRYPFVYDEFLHLYNLVNYGPSELLLTPHGGHLLFFSNLVYYPLHALGGLRASVYYGVALVTHLVNVALCHRVVARFTARPAAAAVGATMWGCAAVNVGALGWFAVYGQVILATILLWLLSDVAWLAARGGTPSGRTKVRWAILLVAACGSFAYGLVIAATFYAVVTFMLDEEATWRQVLVRLAGSSVAVAILYGSQQQLYAAVSDRAVFYGVGEVVRHVRGLSWRDVALALRVICDFAAQGLANLFAVPLLVDQGRILSGPLQGLSAERAILGGRLLALVWLSVFAMWVRRRPRAAARQAIGLALLALACYGIAGAWVVAAGRIFPQGEELGWPFTMLAKVMTPRYQYVPSLLLLIATVRALPSCAGRSPGVRAALLATAGAWAAASTVLDAVAVRASAVGWHPQDVVADWLRRSVLPYPPGSTVYVDNAAVLFPSRDAALPGRAAIALMLFPDQLVDGRRVYFVEPDQELLQRLRAATGTPIARLVVGPDEVPPGANHVRGPSGS